MTGRREGEALEPLSKSRFVESRVGKYSKGDHVKIAVVNEQSGESEWMWLLVERSDDRDRVVFGRLDSEPIVVADMHLGQELAVSYDNIRDHRKFD
jgi:uncharacterized protein YegJ (DUF2314 family)